jgi:hypothetical protein
MAKLLPQNNEIPIPDELVMNQIYNIKGQKVMLDFNLAKLYEIENCALKQAVKRKQQRFPNDFMCQLTKDEQEQVVETLSIVQKNKHTTRINPRKISIIT